MARPVPFDYRTVNTDDFGSYRRPCPRPSPGGYSRSIPGLVEAAIKRVGQSRKIARRNRDAVTAARQHRADSAYGRGDHRRAACQSLIHYVRPTLRETGETEKVGEGKQCGQSLAIDPSEEAHPFLE